MVSRKVNGEDVLVPVVYLANDYTAPTGANVNAKHIDMNITHFSNSGSFTAQETMRLQTDTFENLKGRVKAGGLMHITAQNDIRNLSGTIEGNRGQVMLMLL